MTDATVRRSLEADVAIESLDGVLDLLASWWSDVGEIAPRTRFAFETAVVEVANNIVEHTVSRGGAEGRRFCLSLIADPRVLSAIFHDDGRPAELDLSEVTMASEDDESGRGLAIALASVDTVAHTYEHGRNVWRLECRRG